MPFAYFDGIAADGSTTNPGGAVSTTTFTAATQTFGDTFDALNFQSVAVQIVGTYTGTIVFEVSNDGVNWTAKNLVSGISGASDRAVNGTGVFSGDIGARYFRLRVGATFTGTAVVVVEYSPESQSNLRDIQPVSGTVNAHSWAADRNAQLTSTNLAANASYTGTAVDMGTTAQAFATRVRPVVRHLAGGSPGSLVLQESLDGTNWLETRRIPIPSDGLYHSFDIPLHFRYFRLNFGNGATAQTGFFLGYSTARGDGSSVDLESVLNFTFLAGALTASQTFTSPTLDLGGNHNWSAIRVFGRSDVAGAVGVNWSDDGTTWFSASSAEASTPVAAGAVGTVIESRVLGRYVRVPFVNGAAAATAARVSAVLVSL